MSVNNIINLTDEIILKDTISVITEEPLEILPYLLSSIVGLVFLYLFIYNPKFNVWLFSKLSPTKLEKTPYDDYPAKKVESIISKLSNNYRVLITIYGILLAFVISDKITFAYSNWNFIIWTGWILAVIIKAGMNLVDLSDIIERKKSIERIRFDVYYYREFFKHSVILLVVGIAFLPAFMFLEPFSETMIENLPWPRSISIISGALGIFSAFVAFYVILNIAPSDVKITIRLMYGYAIILFVLSSVSTWSNLSPLEPKLVSLGGTIELFMPQIIVTIISFTAGTAFIIVLFLAEAFRNFLKKKKNTS